MLRPSYLLEARTQVEAERLSDVAFKQVEDRAVDGCIAVQERAGADVVADGEMRRNVFASQLVQSTEGFESIQNNSVGWFDMDGNIQTSPVTVGVTCRIKRKRHLSAEEFSYLRAKTPLATKVPIPSPTMYAYYWIPGVSDAAYDSNDAYLADVVDILGTKSMHWFVSVQPTFRSMRRSSGCCWTHTSGRGLRPRDLIRTDWWRLAWR